MNHSDGYSSVTIVNGKEEKGYKMKKRQKCFIAFILAVSMVVCSMPGYIKAEDVIDEKYF